jgi:hypothetical protein
MIQSAVFPSWWQPVLLGALAGGMGWGIRGQYGHETGAMIAGLLVSLLLVLLFCPRAASLPAARAIAWCTVAIGFGGSMTYGQTIGLTHDAALVGNWAALRWGMLGLAVKGGVWIGFAGLFLGMGLGGVRYRARELLLLMGALIGLFLAGIYVLNSPFDPASKLLPKIYFSADWCWRPDAEDLKPRREVWGGLLLALLGALLFAGVWRRDRLARNLALWGMLGGAVGFPLGQSLQAYHAWNPEVFRQGIWTTLGPHVNWWNMMETAFGATAGAALGLGLWCHRRSIAAMHDDAEVTISPLVEWLLAGIHVALLTLSEFGPVPIIQFGYSWGLVMGLLPIVASAGGRWWPYLLMLPITAAPIAGKTLQQLAYRETAISPAIGWGVYVVAPMLITTIAAVWSAAQARGGRDGRRLTACALVLSTWLYFGLNFAFFRFPWPWDSWTGRTPNAIIFFVCAVGLTIAAATVAVRSRGAGHL